MLKYPYRSMYVNHTYHTCSNFDWLGILIQDVCVEAVAPQPWSLQSYHHVKRVEEQIRSSQVVIICRLHKKTPPIESRTRQNKREGSWTWTALIVIYLARVEGEETHMGSPLGPISTSYPYPLPFNPIYFKLVSFNSLQLLLHYLKQPICIRFLLISVLLTTYFISLCSIYDRYDSWNK